MIARARSALLAFFDAHRRDLPWRRTRDPYAIWVSEVMLQQTRVETVVPYYVRFLESFPTVRTLADAPLERVLTQWSGLGYYRRARLLHAGAQAVVQRHDGVVPADPTALRDLPGVGAYTAGAIASIAFGLAEPIVDGNVERVLTRVFALAGDPRKGAVKDTLWQLARAFAQGDRPGDVNQSLMELGATVCAPTSPRCLLCPLQSMCEGRASGDPERFPEKAAKAPVRTEPWSALVLSDDTHTHVALAPSALGRWEGMLLPPLLATGDEAIARAHFTGIFPGEIALVGRVVHVLTHARMELSVYAGTLDAGAAPPAGLQLVARDALGTHAVPKVTRSLVGCADARDGSYTARRTR